MYLAQTRDPALINRFLARDRVRAYIQECLEFPDESNSEAPTKEIQRTPKPLLLTSVLPQKLPNELLLEIIDHLSPCAATCFGLTCKRVYKLYKRKYRDSVSLDENESLGWVDWHDRIPSHTSLGLLLSDWRGIGPRFRVWQPDLMPAALNSDIPLPAWHFIPIATYGELSNPRRLPDMDRSRLESDLYLRYQDYHATHIDGTFYLPYPRNKTMEEWEKEARQMVVRDRERRSDKWAWIEFWKDTNFFIRNSTRIMILEEHLRRIALAKELEKEGKLTARIEKKTAQETGGSLTGRTGEGKGNL